MRESLSVIVSSLCVCIFAKECLDWCILVSVDIILDEVNVAGFIVINDDNVEVSWESLNSWVNLSDCDSLEVLSTLVSLVCVLSDEQYLLHIFCFINYLYLFFPTPRYELWGFGVLG